MLRRTLGTGCEHVACGRYNGESGAECCGWRMAAANTGGAWRKQGGDALGSRELHLHMPSALIALSQACRR